MLNSLETPTQTRPQHPLLTNFTRIYDQWSQPELDPNATGKLAVGQMFHPANFNFPEVSPEELLSSLKQLMELNPQAQKSIKLWYQEQKDLPEFMRYDSKLPQINTLNKVLATLFPQEPQI